MEEGELGGSWTNFATLIYEKTHLASLKRFLQSYCMKPKLGKNLISRRFSIATRPMAGREIRVCWKNSRLISLSQLSSFIHAATVQLRQKFIIIKGVENSIFYNLQTINFFVGTAVRKLFSKNHPFSNLAPSNFLLFNWLSTLQGRFFSFPDMIGVLNLLIGKLYRRRVAAFSSIQSFSRKSLAIAFRAVQPIHSCS